MNRPIEFRAWDKEEKRMLSYAEYCKVYSYAESAELDFWLNSPNYELMQFTGLLDKNGRKIFEGDLLFCEKAKEWLSGDGYLKKKHPKNISAYLQVVFQYGGFEFKYLRAIDQHLESDKEIHYRCHKYRKDPLYVGVRRYDPKTNDWTIEGDGKTCHDVEIIGNIFEHSKLLEEK